MSTLHTGIRLTLTAATLWAILSLAWMHTQSTAGATDQIGAIGTGLVHVLEAPATSIPPAAPAEAPAPTVTPTQTTPPAGPVPVPYGQICPDNTPCETGPNGEIATTEAHIPAPPPPERATP